MKKNQARKKYKDLRDKLNDLELIKLSNQIYQQSLGLKIWNKNIKTIYPVALSDYVNKNKNNHTITYLTNTNSMGISMWFKVIIHTNINLSWTRRYNLTKHMKRKLGIGWSRI